MDIKLDHYKIFYAVATCGSFTGAAEELFLTQSAVSQAVKSLEGSLGVRLFNRGRRGVELTQEGEMLLKYVTEALSLLDQAGSQLGKIRDLEGGELRIGVGDTIARHLLLPALERFSRMHPGVAIRILNGVSSEAIELLKSGRVDLAMVNMPIVMEGVFIVGEIPIRDCFVAGREYAKKFRGRHVTWQELSSHPLILLERNSSTRRFIDSCFAEKGIVINPEIELGSHDLLIDFASANLGIACAVREFSKKPLESGKVEIIDADPFPKRSIGIFTLREKSTPAAAALLSLLEL